MTYTPFYEGDSVSYVGDGLDGIEPATGQLMSFVSNTHAYVQWKTGARLREIDMVDLDDLVPMASEATLQTRAVISPFGCRVVMAREGEEGVVNYLASVRQIGTWERIAADAYRFVQDRLKVDASMELPYEQLQPEEVQRVIAVSAQVLLRDAFTRTEDE